ncbi:hypothetical protein BU25DRAFT_240532 [Macroventuria anomochaeta]|uniref:Uncharacterized protein n=1 Tax=Macroventuria anomochaeta TaxID=301207 RepID=A0ACB6RK44_9PLEO|nr:uncharacterized protein BU25DRAFT_240532 [Macroventuria anomochaeta]KAF2621339.1 hypothetical protein BU25DRAFT_240532 [Macroventuria anomochaeta]
MVALLASVVWFGGLFGWQPTAIARVTWPRTDGSRSPPHRFDACTVPPPIRPQPGWETKLRCPRPLLTAKAHGPSGHGSNDRLKTDRVRTPCGSQNKSLNLRSSTTRKCC